MGKNEKTATPVANKNTGRKPQEKKSVFARIGTYFTDVIAELKRVIWPSREEVFNSSLVVVVTLVFFILFCLLADTVSQYIVLGIQNLAG